MGFGRVMTNLQPLAKGPPIYGIDTAKSSILLTRRSYETFVSVQKDTSGTTSFTHLIPVKWAGHYYFMP